MWFTLIYAMRRGGWSERSAAWIIVIASVASGTVAADSFSHFIPAMAIFDTVAFLSFFAVGLFSERFWTLWVAGLAGVTLLSHLLPLMPLSNAWVYRQANVLWAWPTLLIVIRAVYQRTLEAKTKAKTSSPE